jgi:hypothetical protein
MASLDRAATLSANAHLGTSDDGGKYMKIKIARSTISNVIHVAEKGRAKHKQLTAPFGDDGWRLLPSPSVLEYTQEMRDAKAEFTAEVQDIQNNWPTILNDEQTRLGPMFNPYEYPDQHEVPNHFFFDHEMRPVPNEGHIIIDIEVETLQEIKDKFVKNEEQHLQKAMLDTWMKLLEPVKTMADICGNDKKVYRSVIANLESVVQIVPALNLVDDQRLTDIVKDIKNNLLGVTVGQIRDDKKLKKDLGKEASKISDVMDNYMGGKTA